VAKVGRWRPVGRDLEGEEERGRDGWLVPCVLIAPRPRHRAVRYRRVSGFVRSPSELSPDAPLSPGGGSLRYTERHRNCYHDTAASYNHRDTPHL